MPGARRRDPKSVGGAAVFGAQRSIVASRLDKQELFLEHVNEAEGRANRRRIVFDDQG